MFLGCWLVLKSAFFRPLLLAVFLFIGGSFLFNYLVFNSNESPSLPVPPLESKTSPLVLDQSSHQQNGPKAAVTISAIVLKDTLEKEEPEPSRLLSPSEKMGRRIGQSMVYIVSPLGRATGCFVDGNGHILTVKQIIGPSKAVVEKAGNEKGILDQIIALEQKRLRTIRQQMTLLPPGYEKKKYQRLSDEKKKELFSSLARSRELETFLQNSAGHSLDYNADIQVFSPDGTQLELLKVTPSVTSDMVLLQVNTAGLHYTPLRPRTIPLKAGDTVFNAEYQEQFALLVQQGHVSENSSAENKRNICTDISLQKRKNGGLLLDRYGNVSGLNNGLAADIRAGDCSIPILTVYEEFDAFLIPQIRAVRSKIIVNGAML